MNHVAGFALRPRIRWGFLAAALGITLAGCATPATPLAGTPGASVYSMPATSPSPTAQTVVVEPRVPAPAEMAVAGPTTPTSEPALGVRPGDAADRHQSGKAQPSPDATFGVTEDFPVPPDRDLFRLAAELVRNGAAATGERTVNRNAVSFLPGRKDMFWLVDFRDMSVYRKSFDLRLVTPNAYWYVEEGQQVNQHDLERAASIFEDEIYPRVTAAFGREWKPGVDNDPHLNILHAGLRGVLGYFSSSDEHPQSVFPFSNERETIYMNVGSLRVDSVIYQDTLAHELQHAVHWNADPSEDTWINEGLSELAVSVAGHQPGSIQSFLSSVPVSLIHWPLGRVNVSAHYGAASLFMHYLAEHYGGAANMRHLAQEPADGIAGIDAYLKTRGYDVTFRDVFRDWAVANLLDEAQGVYGYGALDVRSNVKKLDRGASQLNSVIPQYSVEYLELTPSSEPLRLRFRGPALNTLIPEDVGPQGCWWSNSGDSISSTLTQRVDLSGVDRAVLSYQVWFSLEKDWDFAYLQVSIDGGRTWDILETPHTSPENPIGNSFGPGYTGESRGWLDERIDLSAYAGRDTLVRFQYVTDDAINGAGLCLRQISAPGAGTNGDNHDPQAEGFVLIYNQVKQDYIVQLIQVGDGNRVTVLQLDADNSAEIVVEPRQDTRRLALAVAALAPKTLQPAPYTLSVEPVK